MRGAALSAVLACGLGAVTADGVLELVNRERKRAGLGPLRVAGELARAAQKKAADMARRGYFDHTTPEGRTAWEFMAEEGYRHREAAENLSQGWRTREEVVRGWMGSGGHRANILSRAYRDTGIGVARGARGYVVVQMFGVRAERGSGGEPEFLIELGKADLALAGRENAFDAGGAVFIEETGFHEAIGEDDAKLLPGYGKVVFADQFDGDPMGGLFRRRFCDRTGQDG